MRAYRIPLLITACSLAVFYLWLGMQPNNPSLVRSVSDIYLHGGAYLLFALVIALTLRVWSFRRWLLTGFLAAAGHGLILELLQSLTPTRKADPVDWASDVVGAGIACVVLALVLRGRS